jgi:hypothetical protein
VKFNLAISILIHESPSFFEIQCTNIRHFYPKAIIVVHVGEVLWNTRKKKIKQICQKYDIVMNPSHMATSWASPKLFDAMIGNLNILNGLSNWTHYIFISSNELFVSDLLEKRCILSNNQGELPIIWDSYSDLVPLENNLRDKEAIIYDDGLGQFIKDKKVDIKIGLDFGRVISRSAYHKLFQLIDEYWSKQNLPNILYSQSEVVLPTLIEYLDSINEIRIIRNLYLSTWINNYHSGVLDEYILVKKIPRDRHDATVKKIMKGIGVSYKTYFYHRALTILKKNQFCYTLIIKCIKTHSNIVKLMCKFNKL